MTNTEIIDCTTCKYGHEDERLGIPMCHHPKRFSENCVDFNMHEEKEIQESEKPMQEELEEEIDRFEDWMETYNQADYPTSFTTRDIARHFAKWQKEQMMKDFPKWRRIKAGERLPCPAYVWTIAYDNYPDCFEGRLMPNIEGVKVGRDTWYLPVDVIHNLPKED